jgi:hypothetical protein
VCRTASRSHTMMIDIKPIVTSTNTASQAYLIRIYELQHQLSPLIRNIAGWLIRTQTPAAQRDGSVMLST